jgi:hypothetical protein
MSDYNYAYTKIENIEDRNLRELFDEIQKLRGIKAEGLVIHFLIHSFQPFLSEKKAKFDKKELILCYYLQRKIKDLQDTEIYRLCIDLTGMFKKGHIEDFHGVKLYAFLNKVIPDDRKKKKRKTCKR